MFRANFLDYIENTIHVKYTYEINTSHTVDSIIKILSDPSFLLPRVFKSINNLNVNGSSYVGIARYIGIKHEFNGNVYSSLNEVSYVFTLKHGKDFGTGKLIFQIYQDKVIVSIEYEGWMERMSSSIINKWVKSFLNNFEEDIRLERIKRKI